jgi:hypothetical protein
MALGIMSLFVPQILFFFPLMWIGMYKFRMLEWKNFLASLVATLMIYWILAAWCIWIDDFSFFGESSKELIHFRFFDPDALFQPEKLAMWSIVILLIISLIYNGMNSFDSSIRSRMILTLLTNNTLLTIALILLYSDHSVIFQAILCVPASILIARFLKSIRHWLTTVLLGILYLLLLYSFIVSIIWIF